MNEFRGITETFANADAECDDVIFLDAVDKVEPFFEGDCCGRLLRGRIDVSVSHVKEIALNVAELDRCARLFCLLLASLRELLFPLLLSLARATCSGTT